MSEFTLHESILIAGANIIEVNVYLFWKTEALAHIALGEWGQILGSTKEEDWAFTLGYCQRFRADCDMECLAAKSIRTFLCYADGRSVRIHKMAYADYKVAGLANALQSFKLAQEGDKAQRKLNRDIIKRMDKYGGMM